VLDLPVVVEVWHEKPPAAFMLRNGESRDSVGLASPVQGGIDEQGEIIPPTRQPDWTGPMVDASDVGIGVNLNSCMANDLKIFDRGWIRFELPGDQSVPIVFEFEVRQTRTVREGVQRIGMIIIEQGDRWQHATKVRRFWQYLTACQRKACL